MKSSTYIYIYTQKYVNLYIYKISQKKLFATPTVSNTNHMLIMAINVN